MNTGFKWFYAILSLAIYLLSHHNSTAQKTTYDFVDYLYTSSQHQHLIDYLGFIQKNSPNTIGNDTVNFLKGKSYYHLQKHKISNSYLRQVPKSSISFAESRFLMNINAIYNKDYKSGFSILDELSINDSVISDLKNFELSGLALLNRDLELFREYNNNISKDYYYFSDERATFEQISHELADRKKKSPWVAGLATAIIPGSGKFYAGKRGQGIYSFVISTFLALQVWESYNKDGIQSPRFIIYGSLFSLFHAGNIWSSALTVKNYNNEYNEAANYRIKMDMHIPVRAFFN